MKSLFVSSDRTSWLMVRSSAWPELRKQLPPRASKLDPFKPAIDEILKADLDAPSKQRHTITRIYHRLIDEHQMADVSYPVVRAYVAERKPQIRTEAGRGPAEVSVPQSHRPGDEAEVDFGEVVVRLARQDVRCFLFCLRLSFSGKAVHRVSLSGGQVIGLSRSRVESDPWTAFRSHWGFSELVPHQATFALGDVPSG